MKKASIILFVLMSFILTTFIGAVMYTKSFSPEDNVVFRMNDLELSIRYCQPYKKGRKIFGELVPFGQVWRTGANEATSLTTNQDVILGGKALKSGNYTLYTIPEKDKWTIVINGQTGQWGTIYNPDRDIMRFEVPVLPSRKTVEMFTISGKNEEESPVLIMEWEDIQVKIPFEVST
jgi:hypothetical protein